MKDDRHKREQQSGTPGKNPGQNPKLNSRQDRLARALRENLRRRKSQARGRSDLAAAPSHGDEALPYDGSQNEPGG
jgi:hypothetical protein